MCVTVSCQLAVSMSGSLTRFSAYSISGSSRFFLISSWYRPKNLNFVMLCRSDHQNVAENSLQFCIWRLRISGCRGCVLGKIFSVLRVRQYRILFSSGQSVHNILFIEWYFVQTTKKSFNIALNSLCKFLQPLDRRDNECKSQQITLPTSGQDFQNTSCLAVSYFFDFWVNKCEITELSFAMFFSVHQDVVKYSRPQFSIFNALTGYRTYRHNELLSLVSSLS